MHSLRASLNPWQRDRPDWLWAHQIKCLISAAAVVVADVGVGLELVKTNCWLKFVLKVF